MKNPIIRAARRPKELTDKEAEELQRQVFTERQDKQESTK